MGYVEKKLQHKIHPSGAQISFAAIQNKAIGCLQTVTTLDDRIPPYVQKICKRDPFSGKTVTGGIVTVKDSNWLLSWTFNRQPQFFTASRKTNW